MRLIQISYIISVRIIVGQARKKDSCSSTTTSRAMNICEDIERDLIFFFFYYIRKNYQSIGTYRRYALLSSKIWNKEAYFFYLFVYYIYFMILEIDSERCHAYSTDGEMNKNWRANC